MRLHTVTKVCGDMTFGYFLLTFHVLIEIYPLVPFPPSVRQGVSDVTADVLRRRPMTSAEATVRPGGTFTLAVYLECSLQ